MRKASPSLRIVDNNNVIHFSDVINKALQGHFALYKLELEPCAQDDVQTKLSISINYWMASKMLPLFYRKLKNSILLLLF